VVSFAVVANQTPRDTSMLHRIPLINACVNVIDNFEVPIFTIVSESTGLLYTPPKYSSATTINAPIKFPINT